MKRKNYHVASSMFLPEVVVSEHMITEAAETGNLEMLQEWAGYGVLRVTTAAPLFAAVDGGFSEIVLVLVKELGADINKRDRNGDTALMHAALRGHVAVVECLLVELGADVNQAMGDGMTPLIIAAERGHLMVVRCLIEAGARVGAMNANGSTALFLSARHGHYSIAQLLLERTDANMIMETTQNEKTVWHNLILNLSLHLDEVGEDNPEENLAELTAFLRILVLRGAPPPAVVASLSSEQVRVVQEGPRLRARLPAYLVRRRALLDENCSVLLPPLRALVHGFMELTTTEELWATGLGAAP